MCVKYKKAAFIATGLPFIEQDAQKMCYMKNEWENLDINQLQHLYKESSRQLESSLLHGASWQEVRPQRQDVTDLAIAIYLRLNPKSVNPAEKSSRKEF